ncbi:MAG: DUF5107 domain-containing protein [Luteitalea sp.]|nr:DUF5107 domain-containing protein [Luteitalea sp.]
MPPMNRHRIHRAMLLACATILIVIPASVVFTADHPVRESGVRVWEEDVVIPTYLAGDPEPNPMFFFGRQSQGAEGRVYPYPLYDALTHKKTDKTYKMVYLENEYVRIGVLPEIGGRIFEGFDKTNNYHFFYRQNVIKPALIGLIGAWMSGGIEWNIPHHHRATTFIPVQHRIEENDDGSKTVWVGELEIRHRMRWAVGYTLHPGKAYLEAKLRIVNRTPVVHTMLAFANVAVHVDESYQVIFPPSTQFGTHHHKREFTRWPISDSSYGSGDFTDGVDISWYKNHSAANSVFAWNYEDDFVAGYDHGKQAGTMAIVDHHIAPGKKFWTWGNGPRGRMWDRILTDEDGPYMEIMVGAYSDNQPDYSWLQPYEAKSFSMYWYPFRDIGGAKQANLDAAVNLDVEGEAAEVGFYATAAYPEATVRLEAGDRLLLDQSVAIDPARPFVQKVQLPNGVKEHDLRASLTVAGKELVSYQPVRLEPKEMPEPVETDPPAPEEIETIDELYLTGVWIEQFHNASLEPDPYWEEALRRDSGDTRANTALGINRFKKARYAEAEQHFRKALERLAARYATPKDAGATYYLGLTLKAQGKHDEAFDYLYKSTWNMAWRAPGYYAIAEIAATQGDHAAALRYAERSLEANALNLRAWNLKTALLRHLDRREEALVALDEALQAVDPLDVRSMAERWLLTHEADHAERLAKTFKEHPATAQETAAEYLNAGLWQDGVDVLAHALTAAPDDSRVSPMIYYYLAYFSERLGKGDKAEGYYELAQQVPREYVFPFQWEAEIVLRAAIDANPGDAGAPYYLGNLLYDWQPEEAVAMWEQSAKVDPTFPVVHRNLAIAYAHRNEASSTEKAIASLEKAVSLPGRKYAMHFTELDQLYEATGKPPEERLEILEKNQQVVAERDDALARAISLKVIVGKLDEAIQLLSSNQFSVWEGGTLNVTDPWTDAHLLRGHRHLAAEQYEEAVADYQTALRFPDTLTSERLGFGGRDAEVAYWTGIAKERMGDQEGARQSWKLASSAAESTQRRRRGGALVGADQRYYQALALRQLGEEEQAEASLKELLDLANRSLAEASEAEDDSDGFVRGTSGRRRDATAHYVAGLAHLGLNRQEEAAKVLKEALELSPDLLGAKTVLATISN